MNENNKKRVMAKKLIHCPKCSKGFFINLNTSEEWKQVKKKDFEKMLKAIVSVLPTKTSWCKKVYNYQIYYNEIFKTD